MTPLASIDPRHLSRAQRQALTWLASPGLRFFRTSGGWGRRPSHIRLDVAAALVGMGLARIERPAASVRLVLTGHGAALQHVIAQRAARRAS